MTYRDTLNVPETVRRINKRWGDTLDQNLAVAQDVLILRKGGVSKAHYDELGLVFQYSWFRRLIKIGKHPGINNPNNYEILPNARGTLYQIALLSKWHFVLAKAKEIIHPEVTAKEVEIWRKQQIGCRSNLLFKLTVTEAGSLDDIEKGKKHAVDLEKADQLTAKYREDMAGAGCRVAVKEIISPRRDKAVAEIMNAKKNLTPDEMAKLRYEAKILDPEFDGRELREEPHGRTR